MSLEPATPYTIKITAHRDGHPIEPINHTDAEEAASLISPVPEKTEPVDPEHGLWSVWLPDYMTKYAWESGITMDLWLGGFRFQMDLDPS